MVNPGSFVILAALLLACSLAGTSIAQGPAVNDIQLDTPRAFGYVIGDTFRHRVRLELHAPYRLEVDSLPLGGRFNRWLEMRATVREISHAPDLSVYDIFLDYQIFNAPSEIQRVTTPALQVMAAGPVDQAPVTIPGWEFSVAPIILGDRADPEESFDLRPPITPPPVPLEPHIARFALMAVIFAAAIFYLSWARWGVPLLARANRPFARAYRDLKRLNRKPFDESVYRQALRRLHGAFNETAGRAVFPEQLTAFHANHPIFGGLEQPIDELYFESRSVFFSAKHTAPAERGDLSRLIGLCRDCRERERRPA